MTNILSDSTRFFKGNVIFVNLFIFFKMMNNYNDRDVSSFYRIFKYFSNVIFVNLFIFFQNLIIGLLLFLKLGKLYQIHIFPTYPI